ncbi:MAG: 50S ribosomal protein L18e [Methanocellales archaeon]|nr:50S ribosomal protein L18e [Methanocellales archaeon]MDD3291153.1 50S ribosomal protein L18e [Methanocellales archaeon]MDD5235253.1 50S ribosomal protein L18e [Methanocellales archaeon]MDD5484591.1 50S ribosomal protein L18e [Methanocellales archaeon]
MAKTNPRLVKLVEGLKIKSREREAAIWKDVAKRLERPTRDYAEVNVGQINRHALEGETVLVPGKVLGSGILDHSVAIVALDFSLSARDKIANVKGKCLTIEQLMEENPSGKGVRIIQ